MFKRMFVPVLMFGFLALPVISGAHTPLFSCFDNGDGTVFCEGGFSDGSTAAGVTIIVRDGSGAVIFKGELSRSGDIEFEKPEGDYSVVFDGGEGHGIEIPGSQIFE
jgi:hypothetical protein